MDNLLRMMALDSLTKYRKSATDWLSQLRLVTQMTQLTNGGDIRQEDQVEGLKKTLRKTERKLEHRGEQCRELTNQLEGERKTVGKLTTWVEILESHLHRESQELQSQKRSHQEEIAHYKERMAELDREVKGVHTQHKQVEELLVARSSELKAAQSFLSKTDSKSEVEALQIVRDLNSQILQVAATLTEGLDGGDYQRSPVDPGLYWQIKEFYGPLLVQGLARGDTEALQIAFQACIINIVEQITVLWEWGTDPLIFSGVYSAIYASEEQTVAGRWRALTKTHLQGTARDPRHDLVLHITQALTHIFLCAGVTAEFEEAFNLIKAKGRKGIEATVELALQLNKTFGSEITSSDLSLFHGRVGDVFDEGSMENYYESVNQDGKSRGHVLGGTEFGVVKTIKTTRAVEGPRCTQKVLLKAKVVLESALASV